MTLNVPGKVTTIHPQVVCNCEK